MADKYDFGNLSPIEFEGLAVDLIEAEAGLRFERFSEGADGGVDGRHATAHGDIVLQAKHYRDSTWAALQKAARAETANVARLDPSRYWFLTSQPLTVLRKEKLREILDHPSVSTASIWGRTEINAFLRKHPDVEKRNIKLWLSSAAVLERLLQNEIAVFTEATHEEIERILKVFVVNPSLKKSAEILDDAHCLIISGPPGVGKTTLAQVLAAEYSDEGWELVSIASIGDGFRALRRESRQVFVFDDFLGKIRLDPDALARDESRIVSFLTIVYKDKSKRFILTTRSYLLQAAKTLSEVLDDRQVELSEMVLNLATYTRELKARILYNHLYHSGIGQPAIQALLVGHTVQRIVDHRNYMPRIIQWMTDEIRHRHVTPEEYPRLFIEALDNPERIWDKAFRQHISAKARVLLYCMYFCDQNSFPTTGVNLYGLRRFFEPAVISFGAVMEHDFRSSMFEETLREVKSSFIVIDGERASFINPSVQDYLARETQDVTVCVTLSRSAPEIGVALSIWKKIEPSLTGVSRSRVARAMLDTIVSGRLTGKLSLDQLGSLVGDLILATKDDTHCGRLRKSGLGGLFWTVESKLPTFIAALTDGKFCDLPFAKIYGRFLRMQIYRNIAAREFVMELEELAELSSSLSDAGLEMSKSFLEVFEEAVSESVDAADPGSISPSENAEQVITDWLDQMYKIELTSKTAVDSWKKHELEERLAGIEQYEEMRYRSEERDSLRRTSASRDDNPSPRGDRGFSNDDLNSMFSSLKR